MNTKHDYDNCDDNECYICGEHDCPFSEPLHYHHDGCPACWNASHHEYVTMTKEFWEKNKERFKIK